MIIVILKMAPRPVMTIRADGLSIRELILVFDKRFAYTGLAIITVAVLSFFISKPYEKPEVAPIAESVSGIGRAQKSSSSELEKADYAYIIKEHEGRIAVYQVGADEPELILDVLVKYLPDYDRSQMQDGILVKDYSQLVALIEDYTS